MSQPILLSIHNDIYEVSHFINTHPGEGINNIYLTEHNGHNVTEEYEKFHQTELAYEELISAKNGNNPKIKFVGPDYFQKQIPKYFHLLDLETADINIISKAMNKKSFFMFPSSEKKDKSDFQINLFVKDANGCTNIYPLITQFNNKEQPNKVTNCSVELYDIVMNDDLEEQKIVTSVLDATTIEDFVEKYFIRQKYVPIMKLN